MMPKLCFAILAHKQRPCLDELVQNLRTFCPSPSPDVVVFNGGPERSFTDGLEAQGVDVCPHSRRLKWSNLPGFQLGIFQWLHEQRRDYDFLVTLDADMLLIKPGFDRYLERVMRDSSYMAVHFTETLPDGDWNVGEAHHYHWKRVWQPILGTRNPYQCFNPGQVFRKEYVERFSAFPKRERMLELVRRSNVPVLEEMIFPTLAVTLGCNPIDWPGSQVPPERDNVENKVGPIRWVKRHSPRDLRRHLADPNAFFLHPVPLNPHAVERRLIEALRRGEDVHRMDLQDAQREFEASLVVNPSATTLVKRRLRAIAGPIYWKLRKLYRQAVP